MTGMKSAGWFAAGLAIALLGCKPSPAAPPRAPEPVAKPPAPSQPPTPSLREPGEPPPDGRFARLEWEANRIPLYPGAGANPPHVNEMNGIVILIHELTDPWNKVESYYAQAFKDLGWAPEPGSADRWKHRDGGMELVLQLNEDQVVISLNLK